MKKVLFIALAMAALMACSDEENPITETTDGLSEEYPPLSPYLEKTEYENGEYIWLSVHPKTNNKLPKQFDYIKNVEYFINGKSIGDTNMPPYFTHLFIPNLAIGKHEVSIKLRLYKDNIEWETKTTPFTIIE